jgi:hypothetical protein
MTTRLHSVFTSGSAVPARVINIAVDTAYVYSQTSGPYTSTGIYMMDNNVLGGSTGQGTDELTSLVTAGFQVGFNVFPITEMSGNGSSVEIVAFEISNGTNIFGNFGFPTQHKKGSYQWIGTAAVQGNCTYQIKIGVSISGFPMKYYWWDPFLHCSA